MSRLFIPIVLLLIFLLPGSGCEQKPDITPSGKVLKVGIIGSFTGESAHLANALLEGIKVTRAYKPLLGNGDRIALILKDDKNDPANIKRIMEELATEQVTAALLLSTSEMALELARHVDSYLVPVIAVVATHSGITRDNYFLTQLCFDDSVQSTVAAMFSRDELLVERAATFSNAASPHSAYLAQEFTRVFEAAGGEVVAANHLGTITRDMEATVQWLKQKNIELLYLPVDAETLLQITQSIHDIGWFPYILGSDGLLSNFALTQGEHLSLLDGIMATDLYSTLKKITKTGKDLRHTFDAINSALPTTFSALGAEGMLLLQKAMEGCPESSDAQCVAETLRKGATIEGIMNDIAIGWDGKAIRPVYINTIKRGKLTFLAKVH